MEKIAAKDLRVGDRLHTRDEGNEPIMIEIMEPVELHDISLRGRDDKLIWARGIGMVYRPELDQLDYDHLVWWFNAPENAEVWIERPKIDRLEAFSKDECHINRARADESVSEWRCLRCNAPLLENAHSETIEDEYGWALGELCEQCSKDVGKRSDKE